MTSENVLISTHAKSIVKGKVSCTHVHNLRERVVYGNVEQPTKVSFPFRDLPLLAVFAMRQKKRVVFGQKTSNRGYVLLTTLKAERADKDLMVVPYDHSTCIDGLSKNEKFDPKLERQVKKVKQAANAVKKAELRLNNRQAKLGRLQQPKVTESQKAQG